MVFAEVRDVGYVVLSDALNLTVTF